MFGFERLEVWEEANFFAVMVHVLTGDFPSDQRLGLARQMRRAAVSISANIAAGSTCNSRQDFVHFVDIAADSLGEVVSHLAVSRSQGLLSAAEFLALYHAARDQRRTLTGLRRWLLEGT